MLEDVLERIERACLRVGRDPEGVTLVAVTKGHSAEEIGALLRRGQRVLGENRVQEWQGKAGQLENIEWHFIGNLQRNKVKYCLPFALIHSLASERLAEALQVQGEKSNHVFRVLVEVNTSGETSKQGAPLEEAEALVRYAQSLPNLRVEGLMTMAPYHENPEAARPYFRRLCELRDRLDLEHLSMGMSKDFEAAVEEGATLVRIGAALFP